MPILSLEEMDDAEPQEVLDAASPSFRPARMWATLLMKHCPCSEQTRRIGPNQKNTGTPKARPPKTDRARTGTWARLHTGTRAGRGRDT